MRRILTAAQMREAEGRAGAAGGMPSPLLMENAGRALAAAARAGVGPGGRAAVVCGPGNNGGDGLVAARFLRAWGVPVEVALVGEEARRTPDTRRNLLALEAGGVAARALEALAPLRAGDVAVDALLGTGLQRPPAGDFARAVQWLLEARRRGARVVAADLPSGLQSDSGVALSPCVVADVTVTFGFLKPALCMEPGASLAGRVEVADIGMAPASAEGLGGLLLHEVEEADARGALPVRAAEGHKGTYGHVLVVGGSRGKSGAAALAARAALRSGAGLVTVATGGDVLEAVLAHVPEAMGWVLGEGGALGEGHLDALLAAAAGKDALVVGPGLARGEGTGRLLGELLARLECPAVLDADALNALAPQPALLGRARVPLVLTPHPGEMARLVGGDTRGVQARRLEVARDFAASHGVTCVLKGARSVTAAPDGHLFLNPTGNPGMASGGSGDVLGGVCAAFLAQGLEAPTAAWAAVYAHGLGGDLAARRRGQLGLVAGDLIEGLCEVWTRWGR